MKNKSKTKGRRLTRDEAREQFLLHIWGLVDFWDKESRAITPRAKMTGVIHSLLSTLDGNSLGVPGFDLCARVTKEDREFHKANDENWFPREDIGGGLCYLWFRVAEKHNIDKGSR